MAPSGRPCRATDGRSGDELAFNLGGEGLSISTSCKRMGEERPQPLLQERLAFATRTVLSRLRHGLRVATRRVAGDLPPGENPGRRCLRWSPMRRCCRPSHGGLIF
jgi:hypothetical protein